MHDPEKSDSGIVAMKPMNKAGRPAAELAEPRPGTKGNADQQSTHRTQSRARVIQALDRVRKAARQSKKEQFTSLLHHIERAVPLAFPPSAQLRLSDNDFSGSPQPTPTSSQRNTSGRGARNGWARLLRCGRETLAELPFIDDQVGPLKPRPGRPQRPVGRQ